MRWLAKTAVSFALLTAVPAVGTVVGVTPVAPAWAQSGAIDKLIKRGQEQYDDLSYEESVQTLSAALVRPGSSTEQKIEIYRLLAYNYITLSRFEEADAAVRGILVLDESFRLSDKESPRFREQFDKTRAAWEAEGKPGLKAEEETPQVAEVRIKHSPQAQVDPGTTVKINGTIDDPSAAVYSVELLYRTGTKGKFNSKNLPYSMGAFRGQIPASAVKAPLVEYYLQAKDEGGLPLSSRGDADAPLRIAVRGEEDDSIFASPWFWIPVGVVVVGGVIATAVIVSSGDDGGSGSSSSSVTINVGE